jgi:hypothetical protein
MFWKNRILPFLWHNITTNHSSKSLLLSSLSVSVSSFATSLTESPARASKNVAFCGFLTGTHWPLLMVSVQETVALGQELTVKSIYFWDMTPCSPLCCARRFGGTYRLHLQGRKRWRRQVPPKRRAQLNGLHGVISQKLILFITTGVKTSNPTRANCDAFCLWVTKWEFHVPWYDVLAKIECVSMSFTRFMRNGLTSSRGYRLARKCGRTLTCILWKPLPCSTGFTTLNGDVLCLAEHIMSPPSRGTSTTSFLSTTICQKVATER